MNIRTIQQIITAGNQFNGVLPTTTKVLASDLESFPTDTVGGLFDFGNTNPIRVAQIALSLVDPTSWSLVIVDLDATEIVVLSGTTDVTVFDTVARPYLLEGQTLKLVTAGATAAMRARISIRTTD